MRPTRAGSRPKFRRSRCPRSWSSPRGSCCASAHGVTSLRGVSGNLLRVRERSPFERSAVILGARSAWQHVEGGSLVAAARRLIMASTTRGVNAQSCPMTHEPERGVVSNDK